MTSVVLRSYDDNDGPCVRVSTHDILYIYFIVLHYCKLYLKLALEGSTFCINVSCR